MSTRTSHASSNEVVATKERGTDVAGSRNGHAGSNNGKPASNGQSPSKKRSSKKRTKVVSIDDDAIGRADTTDHEQPSSDAEGEVSGVSTVTQGEDTKAEVSDAKASEVRSSDEDAFKDTEVMQREVSQPFEKPEKYALSLTTGKLIELLRDKAKVQFFHDQHGNAFAWVPTFDGSPHFECLPLSSRVFRAKLMQLVEAFSVKQAPAKVINETIEAAKLLAFREPIRELANRHRSKDGQVNIDLGDPVWKMVGVSSEGWRLSQQTEPMFFRPQHMKALPEPVSGGDPFELFEYVSVESEEDKLLILSWTVSALTPEVPSPILTLTGIQGSAKTTRSRQLRDLTDPSVTPVLGDLELSNLFLTFQHHAVPCLENVSKFSRREADMFCRAVTGNGVERRKLFTNSDQVPYSFRRPIIINGIDTPSTRPDFLDRCIVINCRRIESFRPLKELDEAFQEARPRLFGSLLDLLVKTLKLLPETPPSGEFRMADFAHFGRAMAVALGKRPEDFDNAYRSNIRHQDKEALDATPMTNAVMSFASEHSEEEPWKGSAQQLLAKLRDTAHKNGDKQVASDLPKNARWLSSRLSELVTALATEGVVIDRLPRTSSSRGWKVFMTDEARAEREQRHSEPSGVAEALDEADAFNALESCEESSDGKQQPE